MTVLPRSGGPVLAAMRELGRARRRDGACAWHLYEDAARPGPDAASETPVR